MSSLRLHTALVLLLVATGCGHTGRDYVSFDMYGEGVSDATFEVDGWQVTLERADVAFGPAYFCATDSSVMDMCATALAELLEPATVDALDPSPQPLGEIQGVTGTVRSGFHDYGIYWLKTQARPTTSAAAPEGYSAVFEGVAVRDDEEFRFEARVRLEPRLEGTAAVIGARTVHELTVETRALTVHIDPVAWWSRLDFDSLAEAAPDDGGPVVLEPDSPPYDRLVAAMRVNAIPTFQWSQEDP
jgi:hypothetical protein